MASFNKFEDIEAWQVSREISNKLHEIYLITNLKNDFKLWNQMNGSSGSIMDNIAEGFERGGNKEFITVPLYSKRILRRTEITIIQSNG